MVKDSKYIIGLKKMVLHPGCETVIDICDITSDKIQFKQKEITNNTIFINDKEIVRDIMKTSKGDFLLPKSLKDQITKGRTYKIKARYDHSSPINRRTVKCTYCGGKGCVNCDETGYEPIIIQDASEV